MDQLTHKKQARKHNPFGAAHLNARDAYRDVPVLKQPTWNNEVAAYFFFGGISAGAAVVGALAELAGGAKHKRLSRVAEYVSFVTLLPCPPLLIDDLGLPGRFHHMLRVFKPQSPMNVGSWALITHGAAATLKVLKTLTSEGQALSNLPVVPGILRYFPARLVAAVNIPGAMLLGGYTGVLLGTTSVPVWHESQLLGGLFMSSAFGTGLAATSLAAELTGRVGEEEGGQLAALGAVAGITEGALLAGYVATSGESRKHLFNGMPGKMMAGAVACLLTATAIEAASTLAGKHNKGASSLASVAALAGGALLRWSVVKAGHASAADREGTLAAMHPRDGSPGWRGA
jgi:formate-dependent nitrite reductase membrane component NrfD